MKKAIALLLSALMLVGLSACGEKTVPDVTGKTLAEAKSMLNNEGFYSIDAKDPDGGIALKGTVKAQEPKAGEESSTSDEVTLTVESEAYKASEKSSDIKQLAKDLKGKPAKDAIEQLKKENLLGDIYFKHGAGTDNDEQRIIDDSAAGIEWIVTDTTPHTILSQTIDLTVDTQSNIDAESAKQVQADNLAKKLTTSAALAACRAYGKQQYPYGFKTHDIAGVLQDFTPSDDNTWFYKATVDVTNEYGATAKGMNYECYVTGTTDNPQVSEFNVY
ncbi:PASTA domain-containing protein [Bifidobacterium sp. LC6]|uniref:PASTA domain-containing protein n=1 Tax=Bifidobacterium colobi TaxID=2809026 RepID=A0ABS5UV98_9BIFI|nr:PASTA domain-containing protein [Bifidobacterium colobi]MBT1174671.1 PASTA domain-containing protein [Bifidobacterium colobi]